MRQAIKVRRRTQVRARTASGWRVRNRTTHTTRPPPGSVPETAPATCASTRLCQDAARNSGVFAASRHFALNLMRFNGEQCIATALFDNALCLDKPLNYKDIR